MKRTLHLIALLIVGTYITIACIRRYLPLLGYSDIPSGPITLLELEEFNFKDVKD
ncbi:MAG: hypothetical protein ACI8UQ_001865, partial [Bacteroidia bacterium]